MKMRITLAAALLLAACGGPRQPETGPQPTGSGRAAGRDSLFAAYRGAQMPSVAALIGARERLKLTSAQVTAIDSIDVAVRVQNQPLTDSLRAITRSRNGGPIDQPRNEQERAAFLSVLRRIGENNRRGLDAIQALLTPEQRTGVCTLQQEERGFGGMRRRGGMGGRGGGGGRDGGMYGGGRGMPPGMPGDSIGARGGFGGWPWCGPMRGPRGRSPPLDSARADTSRPRRP